MYLCQYIYRDIFGFKYNGASTRPENSMGSEEQWNIAETALKEAWKKLICISRQPGDGAFYGPKIDFHLRIVSDVHGSGYHSA